MNQGNDIFDPAFPAVFEPEVWILFPFDDGRQIEQEDVAIPGTQPHHLTLLGESSDVIIRAWEGIAGGKGEGGKEGGKEGKREGGREGGKEGGKEGGREGGREGKREGERVLYIQHLQSYITLAFLMTWYQGVQ